MILLLSLILNIFSHCLITSQGIQVHEVIENYLGKILDVTGKLQKRWQSSF